MTPSGDPHQAELDELYGLPLESFTPARDELARRLRKQGDRERADQVKGLRKPSLIAWALNQVRRRDRERVEQLLAAGGSLRAAQQQLLAGGAHGLLRDAVAQERSLVEEIVTLAERELETAGHPANANLHNKLWQTLQAAARDEQTRELLDMGRLVREGQITDFGLGAIEIDLAQAPVARPAATETPPAPASARASAGALAALERKRKAARRRLEQAEIQQRELERKFEELEQRAAEAQAQAADAASAAERARSSAEKAGEKARAAAERAQELEATLAELEPEA